MADPKSPPVRGRRGSMTGKVVSDKMQKTISVLVEHRIEHPVFGKYVRHRTVLKAHDEKREAKEGDVVEVAESRPMSRTKRWRLVQVVRRAGQV